MRYVDLQRTYAAAGHELRKILLAADSETFDIAEAEELKRKARRVVSYLNAISGRWAQSTAREQYARGQREARRILWRIDKHQPAGKLPALSGPEAVEQAVETTILEATGSIMRTVERYVTISLMAARTIRGAPAKVQEFSYREDEEFLDELAREAVKRELSRAALMKLIRDRLEVLVADEDFIEIVGKDGVKRMYNLGKYAKMVARTTLREAQTRATIDTCGVYENDLVEVSSHGTDCLICLSFEGQVYSISGDHPRYPKLEEWTPFHPNCVLPGTRLITPGGIIAGIRAQYHGEAIELTFANSGRLSVTKNHMLLTPHGFAPAHLLRKGDDVFYCPDFQRIVSDNPDENRKPTLVEKIISSLAKTSGMTSRSMPTAPEYLHGDGRFCDGNIDIIGTNGFLRDAIKPAGFQALNGDVFNSTRVALSDFFSLGPLAEVFHRTAHAADGIMGGFRLPSPFFLRRAGHFDALNLREGAQGNAGLNQPLSDNHPMNAEFPGDLTHQKPGLIEFDRLVDIHINSFHGFVYDFQTTTSLYLANGILSSNCLHSILPTSEAERNVRARGL